MMGGVRVGVGSLVGRGVIVDCCSVGRSVSTTFEVGVGEAEQPIRKEKPKRLKSLMENFAHFMMSSYYKEPSTGNTFVSRTTSPSVRIVAPTKRGFLAG